MQDYRDYKDLENLNIAVYNFRGYTVLKFDKKTKYLEIGTNANMCHLIADDLKLMTEFLNNCYMFTQDQVEDVKHIKAN